MAKGGASMMQLKSARNVVQALGVMVDASMISSADGQKLTALLQEFVVGTEYIVDGISRNGTYKVTALWQCEKRCFNGSDFGPFSMTLKSCSGGVQELAVVEFARKAVATLSKDVCRIINNMACPPLTFPYGLTLLCVCSCRYEKRPFLPQGGVFRVL